MVLLFGEVFAFPQNQKDLLTKLLSLFHWTFQVCHHVVRPITRKGVKTVVSVGGDFCKVLKNTLLDLRKELIENISQNC